jgi:hypothetical protein
MSGSSKSYVPPPTTFNPISKYEEFTEIEGVTLFELYGKPRTIETDNTVKKTLSTKVLDSELRCPICLMYLKNTHIVMLCLHRFCGDCIQKSIRIGKKGGFEGLGWGFGSGWEHRLGVGGRVEMLKCNSSILTTQLPL